MLQLTGTRVIAADGEAVWPQVTDPATHRTTSPGCRGAPHAGLDAAADRKIWLVNAAFRKRTMASGVNEPEGRRVHGAGNGGVAGFAKAGAHMRPAEAIWLIFGHRVQGTAGAARKPARRFPDNHRIHVERAGATG